MPEKNSIKSGFKEVSMRFNFTDRGQKHYGLTAGLPVPVNFEKGRLIFKFAVERIDSQLALNIHLFTLLAETNYEKT
ncbi:hypothetical protein T265_12307 [Opisthorchis viverrini]|uniref:Uncharacterized protein n=1 Tax=Opisthorchis viverrini TaxID=6198 RepID=A0A074YUE3_OPIVI|nr:hypothetical protein T265_12307 [Opisthorchis viverrini]KER18328.1 hypothetical protein T265_12307 [Opisthorchis viverrini]